MKKELIEKIKRYAEIENRIKDSPALMNIIQDELNDRRNEMLKDYVYL